MCACDVAWAGGSPTATDNDGKTVLDVAASEEVKAFLRAASACGDGGGVGAAVPGCGIHHCSLVFSRPQFLCCFVGVNVVFVLPFATFVLVFLPWFDEYWGSVCGLLQ